MIVTNNNIAEHTVKQSPPFSSNPSNNIIVTNNNFAEHTVEQSPQFSTAPIFHFHAGCNVTINSGPSTNFSSSTSQKQPKRKRLVIYSDSESSQEY